MRDIINELFVKMSRLVTQYDNLKRFILLVNLIEFIKRKKTVHSPMCTVFFSQNPINCPERAKQFIFCFLL